MTIKNEITYHQLITWPALTTGVLLLIPLLGMQFSTEVTWTLFDFIVAGMLLFGTGLLYKFTTIKYSNFRYKIAVAFALFSGLFLIWVNLAVGLIGSEGNPINLLYFGVIVIGILGAVMGRLNPNKMSQTLFTMAGAQALITVIILAFGLYQGSGSLVVEVIGINGLFVTLFGMAGYLFHMVAHTEVDSIRDSSSRLRQKLIEDDIIKETSDGYILKEDYLASSPSTAAVIVMGRSANGLAEWKLEDRTTLKEFESGN